MDYNYEEKQVYVGETSRAAYTRVNEHMDNYRAASKAKLPAMVQNENRAMCGKIRCVAQNKCKCCVKSWMWEHTHDHHGGVVGEDTGITDYRMRNFKKAYTDKFLKIQECSTVLVKGGPC